MNNQKNILLTGGLGYIGSHMTVTLQKDGYNVFIIDDLSNSSKETLNAIYKITGKMPHFYEGTVKDVSSELLSKKNFFNSVMHFAGSKSVAESVENPIKYYENNVASTLHLISAMKKAEVFNLVFSSSATVYGTPMTLPLSEDHATNPESPYGNSKLMVENILKEISKYDKRWSVGILRYFNPIGAHNSGLIGESPKGTPNNLVPILANVALGITPEIEIFGNDYSTVNGTCMRDYIHVMDLVDGHLAALKRIKETTGVNTWNLGTGVPRTVFDILTKFEEVNKVKIPYKIGPRREGDIAIYYANPRKANEELNWNCTRTIEESLESVWKFKKNSVP